MTSEQSMRNGDDAGMPDQAEDAVGCGAYANEVIRRYGVSLTRLAGERRRWLAG